MEQWKNGPYQARALGQKLKSIQIYFIDNNGNLNRKSALDVLKLKHETLYSFLLTQKDKIKVSFLPFGQDFLIQKVGEGEDESSSGDSSLDMSTRDIEVDDFTDDKSSSYIRKGWEKLTVKELRSGLREAGLPVYGTKSQLIDRLVLNEMDFCLDVRICALRL